MIMVKYRIIEKTYYNCTKYIIQKRLFGFLFWINPFNDEWDSGEYSYFEDALERATRLVARDNHKITRKTVWEA